jgi:hypothetical protein
MRKGILLALVVGFAGVSAGVLLSQESAQSQSSSKGPVFGALSGSNEIGTNGKKGAGDRDGRGAASGILDEGKLCFGLSVKNIDSPVAAHIHRGTSSKNGPVVLTLVEPLQGDPGSSTGCVDISSSLQRSLTRNPRNYYWNVHTQDFPGGAVRGQVFIRTK